MNFLRKENLRKSLVLNLHGEIQSFKEVRVTNVEMENSLATVEAIIYYKEKSSSYPEGIDPSVVFYLIKEKGQWKIDG